MPRSASRSAGSASSRSCSSFFIVLATILGNNEVFGNVLFIMMFVTLAVGIPAACAIAILKYRLYDLDVVIKKTVVFGLLAVFITGVYAVVVGGLGAVIGSRSNMVLSFAA